MSLIISAREQMVLAYIAGFIGTKGYSPRREDICHHFGFTGATVKKVIEELAAQSLVTTSPTQRIGIFPTPLWARWLISHGVHREGKMPAVAINEKDEIDPSLNYVMTSFVPGGDEGVNFFCPLCFNGPRTQLIIDGLGRLKCFIHKNLWFIVTGEREATEVV